MHIANKTKKRLEIFNFCFKIFIELKRFSYFSYFNKGVEYNYVGQRFAINPR